MLKLNIFFVVFVCLISFSLQGYSPSCLQARKMFLNTTYITQSLNYTNYLSTCIKSLNVNNTKVTCQDSGNSTSFKDACTSQIYINSTTSYTGKVCTSTATGSKQNVNYTVVEYTCIPVVCSQNDSDIKQFQTDTANAFGLGGWGNPTVTIKCSSFPVWAIILIVIAIIAVAVIIIVIVVVMLRRRTQYQNI